MAAASGRDTSTTYSAISGGTVVIRDEVAQQNLSGMTAAETIASLIRDMSSDILNALKPIFDCERQRRMLKGWRSIVVAGR
ncbi:hypothetical protein ACOTB3_29455 [Achromobacter xylosoxidans]|uniref:hypothetical protein n=1 Tax=Alcaligenes xylosoxydans xylosoxydans TaxID=85698 RepID=UPI00122ED9EF|nr:hypothetical protein [Achromobacter xylosoxidans]MCZ8439551.1 hypothetical protein [Achromobacter xylosoxidans]NYS17130.1 hypothetical protein [Achromobacter xylosoxidans]QEQ20901.1 hypothetical protein F0U64_00265 [Achromobacter xylosoxidans]